MKRRLVSASKIPNFYVLNEKKERRLVFVTVEFEVIARQGGGESRRVRPDCDLLFGMFLERFTSFVRYVIEYKMV